VRECAEQPSLVVLQVGVTDKWILKLHFSHRYTVKSVYKLLATSEVGVDDRYNHVLWLKQIPLEVNIFRRNILGYYDSLCTVTCGMVDDQDHFFLLVSFYSQLWILISSWLGFSTALHDSLIEHFTQFGGLG